MSKVIQSELELVLVLSPESSVKVPARLTYRVEEPFAVQVTFHTTSRQPVHWTFARELLIEGVFRPSGAGDVRVWPARERARELLFLALSSPEGDALLELPMMEVSRWLERTLRAVPAGTESDHLGLDEALNALLRGTVPDQSRDSERQERAEREYRDEDEDQRAREDSEGGV
ncbi:SsgA family sporulation/cell division regulator [Streptomyces sp. NPDC005438]|uniref:SsgA family sporulation/cell division regulator n=1 Tax=Streptomyces sp. NPDC005438 TaxID=3156880 RepID=UPI0033A5241E